MTAWTGRESKADFVIEEIRVGPFRRQRVRARRHDGTLGEVIAEHPTRELLERVQRTCRDALRRGDAWAVRLVDVSAGQLRGGEW